ncbi:MAG: hypothetical protein K8S54_15970 [Spirochaetia bacterium]|nr:hypothetical protein [Spirochaetia bacterium]
MKRVALFLLLSATACHVDKELKTADVDLSACKGSMLYLDGLCADEVANLKWAQDYKQYPRIEDLTRERLSQVSQTEKSVDRAAALYYHRMVTDPKNVEFMAYLLRREKEIEKKLPNFVDKKVLLLFAPGMFYRDNPQVGADGKQFRMMARKLGISDGIIPVEQTGTIEENAHTICEYVEKEDFFGSIILASLSKGSGDVKRAIQICGNEPYFKKVKVWYNVVGINKGSHLITDIDNTWQYKMEARSYFCFKGYNWDGFMSMRAGAGAPLETPLVVPAHMKIISVVAIPGSKYVSERAKPFYDYLTRYGPNDGLTLLADSHIPEGVTYASWRNDHYFRYEIPEARLYAMIAYAVEVGMR